MCDPVTVGLAAISGVQSMSAISEQNSASLENRANANAAMNDEIEQSGQQYIEKQRSLVQGAFDAVLEGRADESAAYTSAIESGVQGASVKALLRNQKQVSDRNTSRTMQEMESLETQQGSNFKNITAKAQSRINSVPQTSWTIGDAAGILAPIVKSGME